MPSVRNLARLLPGFVAVLSGAIAISTQAQGAGFCTQTADLLLDACKASAADDGAVGRAICVNITGPSAQTACLTELDDSQVEALQLCHDQHDTRLAACGVLGEDRYDPDFSSGRFDNPKSPSHPNPYFPL